MDQKKKLTNEVGAPVPENEHSITAGARGPVVMQDVWLMEKLAHFDREVIPERRMHAKGSGAFGTFKVTHDISKYTKAKVLQPGAETDVFVRFSTVAGERGAADAERDIRGFACKFYTEEGNWDIVGNNTPVFFLRDVHNFPDLNRAVKRDPRTNMRSAQNTWDFWTMLPESFHQRTIVMSDRGIPASYRNMHAFGEHTFSFYNDKNERVWCKFHFHTQQGIKNMTEEEAAEVIAKDRESHQKDLYEAIERGDFPRWTMYVQIMTEEQARNHYENPFDITKVWRHKEFPLIEVGELELNRNPQNYFADVEQAAFTPAHVVPGIGFSPDKFLQGRLFVYGDAQRYRLGVNHNMIPVNRPKVEVEDNSRDGYMRVDTNYGGTVAYTPNGYGQWQPQPEHMEPQLELSGAVYAVDPKEDPTDDNFKQGGELYRVMTEDKRALLIHNTVCNMDGVCDKVRLRHAVHCYWADKEYGERIADGLGVEKSLLTKYAYGDQNALLADTMLQA